MFVAVSTLEVRLDALRRAQNAGGGWGYFPGKESWLEPTVYAALALHGEPAAERAWSLLQSWQAKDGSFRPAAGVNIANWGTSLCLTLAAARGDFGAAFERGLQWLEGSAGVESRWVNRLAAKLGLLDAERDLSLKGWPWKPGTTSWVEPTAHALVALKKAAQKFPSRALRERVRMGQAELLDVRCKDGGWNYGSRAALKVDLPSYPETTALALVGLQGQAGIGGSIDLARRMFKESTAPLARAWLTIALRLHGADVGEGERGETPPDLQIVALEALAAPEGNHRFFKTSFESGAIG
jgi:hypothetical protein